MTSIPAESLESCRGHGSSNYFPHTASSSSFQYQTNRRQTCTNQRGELICQHFTLVLAIIRNQRYRNGETELWQRTGYNIQYSYSRSWLQKPSSLKIFTLSSVLILPAELLSTSWHPPRRKTPQMQNHGTHLFCHGAKNTQGALILVDISFTREHGNIDILTTLTWKAQ